jgi:hypothetical protein
MKAIIETQLRIVTQFVRSGLNVWRVGDIHYPLLARLLDPATAEERPA